VDLTGVKVTLPGELSVDRTKKIINQPIANALYRFIDYMDRTKNHSPSFTGWPSWVFENLSVKSFPNSIGLPSTFRYWMMEVHSASKVWSEVRFPNIDAKLIDIKNENVSATSKLALVKKS
jgi:hypothetical protein